MPVPVISATSSYIGFKRNETFAFQPSATGSPFMWESSGLPTGVTIDTPVIYAATGVAATDVVTGASSAYANGNRVFFPTITGGAGLTANTIYFVRDVSSATFKLAATLNGTAINFTTDISAGTIQKVSTGLISGAVAVQGPYVFSVTATNVDGASAAKEFCIGISSGSATAAGASDTAVDLVVDVVSRLVRLGLPGEDGGAAATGSLLYVKESDTVMFIVRFEKGGVQIDPDLTDLRIVFKQLEPDAILVDADAFEKTGSAATAAWILPATFTGDALAAALADNEGDAATTFAALTEIEWRRSVTFNAAPLELVGSSRTFLTQMDRDLAG